MIAAVLCLVTFVAKGAIDATASGPSAIEIALTIGAGLVVAATVVLGPSAIRPYGIWALALLLCFSALSALSVIWSVVPDSSWENAGELFAYSGVFATAVMLARAMPGRWSAVLGGITLAAVVVCGYALLTKVLPAQLEAVLYHARLSAPYGYWNAIGLTAAMGAICCLWLAARRSGRRLLSVLAYPGLGITLVTLLLAYSRGALIALALGLVLWFCVVPLRLRGAAALLAAGICAGLVVIWDFSTHALTTEGLTISERAAAGHRLGALLVAMILLLGAIGLAVGFLGDRRPLTDVQRHRSGTALLGLVALAVIVVIGALAASHRGLFGTISHTVDTVTNPNAPPPANVPGRLTAAGSVRARYWKEALEVFKAHKWLGTGARSYGTSRLRYANETLEVRDAHGYIVQTLADLGLLGLAVTLGLLISWMVAAGRSTHPFDRRFRGWRWKHFATPYTPERVAMLTMLCVVVVFGIQSFADWTWFIPGDACVALLCAGWLAGRGPLPAETGAGALPAETGMSAGRPAGPLRELSAGRLALALTAIAAALLAAWVQWEPVRSVQASEAAEAALETGHPARGISLARIGVQRNPLSAQARFTLAAAQQAAGHDAGARATYQEAVREQPSNPQTWLYLGNFELERHPRAALADLSAVIYLFPEAISAEALAKGGEEAIEIHNDYIQALRAVSTQETAARNARAARRANARRRKLKSANGSR